MALRPLTQIEKNKLLNYSDFVGTVEQAAREKSRFFNGLDLHNQALPAFNITTRQDLAKLKIYSQQIRDGQYTPLDLAKKFLAKHTANIDDVSVAVDILTAYMQAQGQFDTYIDQVFREAILTIEM